MITDYLHNITQSTDIPLLTAFVLGLLTALNPCQLAISVSALAYEYRSGKGIVAGLMYAFGRTLTYILLGWILMCLIGGGRNIKGFEQIVSQSEVILPYVLIAIGLFMLTRAFHRHEHEDNCHNSKTIIKRNGPLGSLILGMTLALAFCPESAVFYFGLMIPLAMSSSISILIPIVFALAAAIPVAVIAYAMSKTYNQVQKISHTFDTFQMVLNGLTGILFIIIAVLLLIE